jgi:hypothetical protein
MGGREAEEEAVAAHRWKRQGARELGEQHRVRKPDKRDRAARERKSEKHRASRPDKRRRQSRHERDTGVAAAAVAAAAEEAAAAVPMAGALAGHTRDAETQTEPCAACPHEHRLRLMEDSIEWRQTIENYGGGHGRGRSGSPFREHVRRLLQ